jgi:crotonobetainyl-CoA:carnitine CoA-transferase CaiB-like acyl-CoA transferase
MNLAIGNDDMWARLCAAIGRPGLAADERFARGPARVKNRRALDELLESALAERPAAEWVEVLNAAGVACGPILTLDQVFADPQVRSLGLVHEQQHADYGPVKVLGLPVDLSRTPPTVRTPAPVPGADTREVLRGLGYDAAAIDALAADGVVEVTK